MSSSTKMTADAQSEPLKTLLMKQMEPDRRDRRISWRADFVRMELPIHVDFICPATLVQFLARLHLQDERFQKAGIIDVIHICSRFTVKLYVAHGDGEVCYRLRAYRPFTPRHSAEVELEFTPYQDA